MLKLDVYVLRARPCDEDAFRRRRQEALEEGEGARRFYLSSAGDVLLHELGWCRLRGEVSDRQWGEGSRSP
jgi:hypothetical protein